MVIYVTLLSLHTLFLKERAIVLMYQVLDAGAML